MRRVDQIGVNLIADDQQVVAPSQMCERVEFLGGHHPARGIVAVDQYQSLRPAGGEVVIQPGGINRLTVALVVHRDGQ